MRLLVPVWLCVISIWLDTGFCSEDIAVDLVAAAHNLEDGTYTVNPCQKINCSSYNVSQFHVNIVWSTVSIHEPFSILVAASTLQNTSDIFIIADDLDCLLDQAQRLRIPDSQIIPFPRQRNPNEWWKKNGLKPLIQWTMKTLKVDDFEFCESKEKMSLGERNIIVKIIRNLKWDHLVIICDANTEHEIKPLSDDLSSFGVTITILAVNISASKYSTYPGLKIAYDVLKGDDLKVLLLCSRRCVRSILDEANIFDAEQRNKTSIRHSSKWLISQFGYNKTYLENSGLNLDNIAVLTGTSYHDCYRTSMKILLPSVIETVISKIKNHPDLSDQLTIDAYFKEEIISILKNPSIKARPFIETLLWRSGSYREMSNIAIEDGDKHFLKIFPNAAFGFNQRLFQVATLEWSPFVIKTVVNESVSYSGLCMDLLMELAISLNFTFKMVEPADGEWGRYHNKEWTGLIGEVAKHESDMILAAVTVSDQREAVMDFTFPYFFGYSVVFFRKSDPNVDKWYTLLAPFRWEVLICIFCTVVFVGFLFYFTELYNPFYPRILPNRKPTGIQRTFWYIYGALLAHGGHAQPYSATGRLIISTWWLFCIVCTATYSGNLIAFLTVGTKKVPFTTLAEMVTNDEYSWGYLQGSFLETLFKNSNLPVYQKVWKGVQRFKDANPDHLHPDMDVHFNRLMNSKYAVIDDGSAIFSWSEHQCDIQMLNERFFPNHYAIGLPNNSPFTSIFSDQMIKIYESGLLQVWQQMWWPKTKFCSGSSTNESSPIDLLSLQSAFYVLGIGVFLACSILGIEYLRKECFGKSKHKHKDLK